ncbi:hypothetical protein [Sphingomonas sp. R86520]|uniref:hypothetical protein n=1 Tax=Sphingomonas sp. R86520 TaxID=3093859 RepID=UPI0036D20935
MFFNGTTTNSMDFAIPGQSDTIEIYSPRNSGLGAFTAAVDGGAVLQTVVQDGVDGFIKTTITVTRGAHTLNLSRVSGLVFITGVIAFDSTVPAVDVVSAGWLALPPLA